MMLTAGDLHFYFICIEMQASRLTALFCLFASLFCCLENVDAFFTASRSHRKATLGAVDHTWRPTRSLTTTYAKKNKGTKSILREESKLLTPKDGVESVDKEDATSQETSQELDERTRAKLKEEIASPFRKFRQFIYAGTGLAGGIGTLTAVPQLLFAFQDGGDAIGPAVTNIVIDIGAIIGAVALWDRDSKAEKDKIERFTEKERRFSNQLTAAEKEEREQELSLLPVQIQVNEKDENVTRIVSFGDLQLKGKQNVIVFAGKRSIVKDAVISARIEGVDLFNSKETFVVPVVIDDDQLEEDDQGDKKGFGAAKESMMTAPYIAKPTQIGVWERYLQKEIDLAKLQGETEIVNKGLVIAVKQNGKVVRRGVGLPPWKQVVEELQDKITVTK